MRTTQMKADDENGISRRTYILGLWENEQAQSESQALPWSSGLIMMSKK